MKKCKASTDKVINAYVIDNEYDNYSHGEPPMLEQERFVSGGEYGGSEAESGGLSGIPCLSLKRG